MKDVLWDINDAKRYWKVKDDFVNQGVKRLDRLGYHYTLKMIARKHLKNKNVLELFGGVGMSSYQYAKYAKKIVRIDIDNECNRLAKLNLSGYKNIEYIEGDFVEKIKSLKRSFHFVDADGYATLDVMFYENLESILKLLRDDAIGFYTTNNYQFLIPRNFKSCFERVEKIFGISFSKEVRKNKGQRSEIFNRAFAEAIEKKCKGKFVCSFVYLRQNISHLLFLRSDLFREDTEFLGVYKRKELFRFIESVNTKSIRVG